MGNWKKKIADILGWMVEALDGEPDPAPSGWWIVPMIVLGATALIAGILLWGVKALAVLLTCVVVVLVILWFASEQ
ncbi:hypothetical protein D2T31_00535 [Sinirhodobacter populi]|uniref:Uncharacterized protein n=1 Tax=Paenirhodobacter populi TaxID=2306993 RepID=A0A443KIE5_9RHOB|nr:hypothetical protein [Sinirhodobacter populi]RWR32504.1 hypothetical protein D2T31_00535 [Sinirhodobacter populi]